MRDSVSKSALAVIAGIVLSGPVALVVVGLVHPQPPWRDVESFAAAYHPIQLLPYLGGFLLIGGCVALVASLRAIVPPSRKARANVALVLTGAFAALILLNYIVQTTFVPSLVAERDPLIAALAMANPRSLAWALEMWGYAVFGVATWAIACAFHERVVAAVYVANGAISVVGGVATMVSPGWVTTPGGYVGFALWNVLMIALGALTIAAMRGREMRARVARLATVSATPTPIGSSAAAPGR